MVGREHTGRAPAGRARRRGRRCAPARPPRAARARRQSMRRRPSQTHRRQPAGGGADQVAAPQPLDRHRAARGRDARAGAEAGGGGDQRAAVAVERRAELEVRGLALHARTCAVSPEAPVTSSVPPASAAPPCAETLTRDRRDGDEVDQVARCQVLQRHRQRAGAGQHHATPDRRRRRASARRPAPRSSPARRHRR